MVKTALETAMKILVSDCLLGHNCRYCADNCKNDAVLALGEKYQIVGVCPEQVGGLSTPRPPAERVGDKIIAKTGADVTAEYTKGAQIALQLAKDNQIAFAVLKSKSPSCGKGLIYDGTFTGGKVEGNGVTTELLLANGFTVYTEEELDLID